MATVRAGRLARPRAGPARPEGLPLGRGLDPVGP